MKVLQGSLGLLVGHYSWMGVWRVGRVWGKNQRRSVGNATMMPIWAPRRAHVRLSPHHAWLLQPRLPYSRGRRTQLTQPRLSPACYQPRTGTQIKLTGNKPSLAGRLPPNPPPRLQQPTPFTPPQLSTPSRPSRSSLCAHQDVPEAAPSTDPPSETSTDYSDRAYSSTKPDR